jgi:uncharacterized Zn-finger protein
MVSSCPGSSGLAQDDCTRERRWDCCTDQHQPALGSTEQALHSSGHGDSMMQAGFFSDLALPSIAESGPDEVRGNFEMRADPYMSAVSGPVCQPGKIYTCSTCGKSFSRSTNLTKHMRIHTDVRRFACETCGRAFLHARDLERHTLTHTGLRPFACTTCGKAFSRSSDLTTHERTHSGDRPFKCPTCGKAFAQSANLVKHRRSLHSFEGSTNGHGAGSLQ